jgi:hypothetical protein
MDSGGISRLSKKAFWPLPWELNYKKETPQAFRSMLSFFSKKKSLSQKTISFLTLSFIINISCISILDF